MCGAASVSNGRRGARSRRALWLLCAVLAGGGCSRLARCELDKVRAAVLDYDAQMTPLRDDEARLRRRMDELDDKIFTNQKAGVDLLRAVLVEAARRFVGRLMGVRVRSHLILPHHERKVAAYARLVSAYEALVKAYTAQDFDAVRAGLEEKERATHELEAADLQIRRLLVKYRSAGP